MFWNNIVNAMILIAIAGIPILFYHGIGWVMFLGGIYISYLLSDKALQEDRARSLKKFFCELKSIGQFSELPPGQAPKYDSIREELEASGFIYVKDVKINSEKKAVVRLMHDPDKEIWAVIRKKALGSVNCTFYAFAMDATIIAFSNVSTRMPNIKNLPQQMIRKNLIGTTVTELYRKMVEEVRHFALSYPESFSMLIMPLASSEEFICSLDKMKLRERMAELCFKPEDIPQTGLSESERILLGQLMFIIDNGYREHLPSAPALRLISASGKVRSRLGGLPDLPSDMEWPKTPDGHPMNFIGQFDCSEIPETDGLPAMPKSGILSFFYAYEGEGEYFGVKADDECGWKVLYTDRTVQSECQKNPDGVFVFKEYPVTFTQVTSYLNGDRCAIHHMFGYPDWIQSETMAADCARITAEKHQSQAEDWLLLLQVVTDHENSDLQWGDVGTLFFWITHEDLSACRFDRVWLIMECY